MNIKTKVSKIKVVVRKRPANHREYTNNDIDIITTENKNTIIVKELKNKVDLTKYIEEHKFTFDRVYADESTNQQIYNEMLKPMITAAFNKTKITCFAYGQTGSGKTYTMLGNNNNFKKIPGLFLLSCIDLFSFLQKKEYENLELYVSFYEIYCNKLFDLLNNKNILQAREDGKQNICIVGLIEKKTKNINELLEIINNGLMSRTVGITGANLDSSRSHAILQIAIKNKNLENYSKISFIDLAGSERAVDTIDTNKKTKIDSAEINKSLLALKECIRALDMEKKHKPFRGSKLTLVLRDSFIGNCLTLMIANISPCLSCSEHTLNTLRYADRVKELRKPKNEREYDNNFVNKNKNCDLLNELLMMPKIGSTNIKYKVEIKKNSLNNSPNNLMLEHGYNYMKLKNKNNFIDFNKDIQKPDSNIMKIDDIIKNEKIHTKYNLTRKRTSLEPKINFNNFSPKKNNNEKLNLNADDYISKYSNLQIKNDEEYQNISQIHEELINDILKEEDEFIIEHKKHIDDMVESVKEEMSYIHEVDKPGSDIEEYTNNLDKILLKEISVISSLRERLNKFRIMLKDESALAVLFDEEDDISASENGYIEKEESNEEKINKNNENSNKPKFQFKKK